MWQQSFVNNMSSPDAYERLKDSLNKLRESHKEGIVFTTEIIDIYMGGFHSNRGVSASDSWNA
ncbi:hypothetical protein [Pectobacterium cacticida]|uniref:hypothetical protein n=1 Tax=Pectobacterium cacticida TaxID=69221 RepID=UPI002FF2770C